ncbi:uncharacterized protein BDZ83DRAFT_23474 [Colletotrichum acutatum]|uniref:Uncharacterized protein n=1 Tax=Glomerella acutata TaxID=27357 RepID=A0AAD8UHQ9_GLOAC|nr:uncharacterized protein BDZ83DRAFT_23474 [Colletotrichum acutatum]KAK1717463.1 hypothetical protein BDZ83DRAFT_23474 [Colletotrichum acutatum]
MREKINSLGCHQNSTRFSDPRQTSNACCVTPGETQGKPNADDAFDCFCTTAHLLFVKLVLFAISFWVCGLSSRGTCPPRWRPSTSRWASNEAQSMSIVRLAERQSRHLGPPPKCVQNTTPNHHKARLPSSKPNLPRWSVTRRLSFFCSPAASPHLLTASFPKTSDRVVVPTNGYSLPEDPVPSRLQPQGSVHGPQAMVHKPYPDDWKARRARADQGIFDKCRLSLSLRQAGMAAPCIGFG